MEPVRYSTKSEKYGTCFWVRVDNSCKILFTYKAIIICVFFTSHEGLCRCVRKLQSMKWGKIAVFGGTEIRFYYNIDRIDR